MTEPAPRRRRQKIADAPRSGRARAVADMLPQVGGAAFRRFGFVQASVVSRWREIVGESYARISAPESIRFPAGKRAEGVLNLVVDGAHATMLQHVAPTIVERVNRFFGYGAVARVVIRHGRIATTPRKTTRPTPPAFVPAEIGDSLRSIADPELRATLESLARGIAAGAGLPRIS